MSGTGTDIQLSYAQEKNQRNSLLPQYASYAVELMSTAGEAYTATDGTRTIFPSRNFLGCPDPILISRIGSSEVPVILFRMWILVVMLLCAL